MTATKCRALTAALAAIMALSSCGVIQEQEINDEGPLYKSTVTGQAPDPGSRAEKKKDTKTKSSDSKAEPADTDVKQTDTDKKDTSAASDKVQKMVDEMSVEEKVGQMFIVRADTLEEDVAVDIGVSWVDDDMKKTLSDYHVGGVIYFANNCYDPDQLLSLSEDLQASSDIPLFIGIDEEGGSVARIANNPEFGVDGYDSMLSIGNTGNTDNAEAVGETIGAYLSEYGINLDFAPVADIFTNPSNTVIGNRSFGTDAETVSSMVSACIDGFHSQDIMTCLKHYPGHGDTSGDTHTGYVQVTKTWDELLKEELVPFIDNIDKTDMIMAAHLTLPNVTSDGLPASLSKELLTDKLRGELGYDGVIITDSLLMGAVADNYSSAESAVKVVNAGADIILMPYSLSSAYNAVVKAVNDGSIPEERINESVTRILSLKEKYGLI
ncbi:MAG: glycoside hydrolase family 3 protein [Ruminococcus sp.]|nr:glycoside hydrolase family 3 protein [Ruminococcus sp.]